MKKFLVLCFACLGFNFVLMAQDVKGIVVDAKGNPMPFVNVVELSQADSAFQQGAVSQDNGAFALENVKRHNILRFSYTGYETIYFNYTGQDSIAVRMKENAAMLGEVVVKSHLPKTVLRGEGMTTIVAGSILEKTSDMDHLLSRIPSVTSKDGAVKVFGRGTPVIYINGRPMLDKMELQRLQPSEIKKIEVISNPGARYSASVKSVIRITTKKRRGEGFSFDNKTTFRLNEDYRLSSFESFSANYRKGGLDINGYLYGAYSHTSDNKLIQQFTYQTDTWQQNTKIDQEYTKVRPYARLGVNYAFDSNNSIGARITYDRSARDEGDGTSQVSTFKNQQLLESLVDDYTSPGRSTKYYANAYYMGKIGNVSIDLNTDYYWYGKKDWMNVHETVFDEVSQSEATTSDVNSYRNSRNSLLASKLVFTLPLLKGTLSFGGEYSYVNRRMRYEVTPAVTDGENEKVNESMTSGFVDYGRSFGPLYVQAGLRYEYNDFDYYAAEKRIAEQSKNYGNWFPSLALSMPVGKTQMQLTYAADIYRPSYSELRSGVQYDNLYTYDSGNPFLVPSITRNVTYAFSWSWLYLQLIYSHVSDEVCSLVRSYKDDPMKSLTRPENINSYNSFQAGLTLSPSFGIWHPQLELMLFKQWLRMDTHVGNRLDNPVGVAQLTNTFDLKWLTASIVMTAQTEGNMGNKHIRKGYFNTDLSLYKSMMKKRLILTLDVSDLFGTGDQYRTFYSGPQRTMLYDAYSTSTVTLGIRYRFNAASNKYKGTGAGQSQKSRM